VTIRHNIDENDRDILAQLFNAAFDAELLHSYMELDEDQKERYFELREMLESAEAIVTPEKKT
jgi:hypothetical protein